VTRVDPLRYQVTPSYLVIFAGTNDIHVNGTSGAATWTLLETYINARISAGWTAANICVVTMLPRQNAHEADRTAYNNAIRSNQATYGYVIADMDLTALGVAGAENNTALFADQIHPTAAGHVMLQTSISAVLFP
jgi:phospholipase/lecithinase/hemolysin